MADYIDPNHEKLQDVEERNAVVEKEFDTNMQTAISSNKTAKNEALKEIDSSTAKQEDALNKQTDFAIEEIKQQKAQAEKDYTKEQSGAYADWQKQSNAYGANAEARASSGLQNSGYAESSQVSMYNQYQARITAARESFVQLKQDYDNAITQARLQNSSALAQIYADAAAKRAELIVQFAFKNTELLTTLAQQKAALKQQGFSNYMTVYNQLVNEKQFNENLAEQKRQHNESMNLQWANYNLAKEKYDDSKATTGGGGGGGDSGKTEKTKKPSKKTQKIIDNTIGGAASGAVSGKKTSSEPTVDMASVLALGYGPINAKALNRLIKQGKVVEYEENGKLKYKKQFNRGGR